MAEVAAASLEVVALVAELPALAALAAASLAAASLAFVEAITA
jgi:hypothetical protein